VKWQTGISILNLSLASLAFALAGFNYSAAGNSQPSSVLIEDSTGRQIPLDTLLPPGATGLIGPDAAPKQSTPAPAAPPPCVNINTADQAELITLKGIGPAMSQRIISHRAKSGPFRKKEDLLKVKGIGPAKFGAIADNICL